MIRAKTDICKVVKASPPTKGARYFNIIKLESGRGARGLEVGVNESTRGCAIMNQDKSIVWYFFHCLSFPHL